MPPVGLKYLLPLLLCLAPVVVVAEQDGVVPVWVWFTDKGVGDERLAEALAAAGAALDERCLSRRAKMVASRDRKDARLVDETDLPLHRPYLERVLATGAGLRHRSRWLNAASFEVTPGQRRSIAGLDCVTRVAPVARRAPRHEGVPEAVAPPKIATRDKYAIDYGASLVALEQINVPAVHEAGYSGAGVVIGMIDSGFRTTHESLVDVDVLATWDFIGDDPIVDTEEGDAANSHHHGTYTLSTVGGWAPGSLVGPAFGASFMLARTENVEFEEPIEEDHWVAAIEWLEAQGVDVVSSSVGYYTWYEFEDIDGETAPCTIAADLAAGKGVVVVNSAGNWRNNFGHIFAPADGDSVIAVGAVTATGDYANFSSPGPTFDGRIKPDVCALGLANHLASPTNDEAYVSNSGTSFSAPLAAGVAALVLQRAPTLTPMQVREAMRRTADRALAPDNDYGWGILDAEAAVAYFGPVFEHEPLGDTESTGGELAVLAMITDKAGIDAALVQLHWRFDGGSWQQNVMEAIGADDYRGAIDIPAGGAAVEYWLSAADDVGLSATDPPGAPAAVHAFFAGPDIEAPAIEHRPLRDQPLVLWPPVITVTATDNIGVAGVRVVWSRGGVAQPDFDLVALGGGVHEATLPLLDPVTGDQCVYSIIATDVSAAANETTSGPHGFGVIDAAGLVLVINDGDDGGLVDEKFGAAKESLPAKSGAANADSIAAWLGAAGYVTSILPAADATGSALAGYSAVVLSCGDNTSPLAGTALREALLEWVRGGGRLFVEGGEVGYDALYRPGYADFAAEVLHATQWHADDGGELGVVASAVDHPLLRTPHDLGSLLTLDYAGYGDQDVVTPSADAQVLWGSALWPEEAGLLVFDDNQEPQAVQIVYCAADLGAIGGAHLLVENALACLLASESPSTAAVSGRVRLVGSGDHSGVEVTVAGASGLTDMAGDFRLEDLPAGAWTLRAMRSGWSTVTRQIELDAGQTIDDIDIVMAAPLSFDLGATPDRAIPDLDPVGIVSTITVAPVHLPGPPEACGPVSALTVSIDLTHSWISDLTVDLLSPAGTSLRLHDRSGGAAADLAGTWGLDLEVDGPGTLADVVGEDVFGDWTLRLADHVGSDTGVLNAWTLHFECLDAVSVVPADGLPARTVLHGAAPNPFNPRTVIAFDLAAAGPVRLTIFDLRGRAVRRLVDEHREAGAHRVAWDGRDEAGRGLASGSYLCRLDARDAHRQRKLLLLR